MLQTLKAMHPQVDLGNKLCQIAVVDKEGLYSDFVTAQRQR